MIPTAIKTLTEWTGGRLIQGDPAAMVRAVSTDTRTIQRGELFVALTGENFDGHSFLGLAAERGAVAFMVDRELPNLPPGAVIRVDDTLRGLQKMANAHRRMWGGKVVGLTGSNGKTSTKDMIASVLGRKFRVRATRGNLNNHIGLPLTALAVEPGDEVGVFEMGMNHHGEIAPLAAIAEPDCAVITNIGTAHIEFLGSREGIAQEKGELVEAVRPEGFVVLNANDDFSGSLARRAKSRVLRAGLMEGDVRATGIRSDQSGSTFEMEFPNHQKRSVHLPIPGRHMVGNATLAAAVGYEMGVSLDEIVKGLEEVKLTKGRVQIRSLAGITFIDDSYNANPDSMAAALETLKSFGASGRRIAVLGRMGELGPHAESEHSRLGERAAAAGLHLLCTVGEGEAELIATAAAACGGRTQHFSSHAACAQYLSGEVIAGDVILVKGSRSAAMEKVITEFEQRTCSIGSTN